MRKIKVTAKPKQTQSIYIHIGYPKTGTTSLQSFFRKTKEELSDIGFHYVHSDKFDKSLEIPLIAAPEQSQYFENQLRNKNVYHTNYKDRVTKEIKNNVDEGKSILISNESFITRFSKQVNITNLHSFISQFNIPVKIVVYLRRQDDFVSSIFSSHLRDGAFRPIIEQFRKSELPCFKSLDYSQLLDRWGSVFGKENLIVKLYDKSELVKEDIISDFLSTLNLPCNGKYIYDSPIHVNQAFGKNKILFLQHISTARNTDQKVLEKLIPIFDTIPNSGKYTLPHHQREEVLQKYYESNLKLGIKYFGLEGSPFKELKLNSGEPKQQEISMNDTFNLVGEILSKAL